MDGWVSKQWENKKTQFPYGRQDSKCNALRKRTNLAPGYLVRYADDFVIITDTRAHAEGWKARLQIFLQNKMKLTLSKEKTLVTDVRKKYIKFLGYQFKLVPGKARKGYIPRTIPDKDKLGRKACKIAENIRKIPQHFSKEQLIGEIHHINSQIRGLIQYYAVCL